MLKKLRRKFVAVAVSASFVVLALLVLGINAVYFTVMSHNADEVLLLIAENSGRLPEYSDETRPAGGLWGAEITEETPYETRYFAIWANQDMDVTETQMEFIASVTGEDAEDYFQRASASGKAKGYVGSYRFYRCTDYEDTLFIFLNCGNQLRTARNLLIISVLLALLALCATSALVFLFSKQAVSPIVRSMERQKQFITDASHEIKTPLTVITACADIMELENQDSEWIKSIKGESLRLAKLVSELIILSRWEEDAPLPERTHFSLSEAAWDAVTPFQALAEARQKALRIDIADGITYYGEEASIQKVLSILLDNAIKYCGEDGEIRLRVFKKRRMVSIEVSNACTLDKNQDLDRLFDRFYRADPSRSRRTGGNGVGLSIAKAIVEAHGGTISARSADQTTISFLVRLPI